ncbi:conserved hypothetical protein [Talaromyces stipitatus ATCC 10500]|uniref:Uncharacterized protein n=1 Tax=Talaromyces stipitatus (strain ATCC 10500 / CBS 375.48 / QM 6759 / NRRL 1006) TaxID=441959 RepID=B8LWM1_TALSN|nr:uncharacterized protein TSTA_077770 [Talaromyces stipitatus ATCC 10500]EED24418.1 conserved hypothetical protein [Talaromyces stipitatus ATCC 10500]
MSRTSTLLSSTETLARLRVVGYLSDYDIHHSSTSHIPNSEIIDELPSPPLQSPDLNRESPEWPNHYRRIPPYRPVNHDLDQGQRRVYTSGPERAFIAIMFLGVRNNARLNKLWRMTGEKINDQVFGYKIGGEW